MGLLFGNIVALLFLMNNDQTTSERLEINILSKRIIDHAMKVHSELGPGMLESAYEACLAFELRSSNIPVDTQVPMPLNYRGVGMDIGYRLDILVGERIIVEIKSVKQLRPVHKAQILSYLKMSGSMIFIPSLF